MFNRITNWFKNWHRAREVKKARAAWVKALRSGKYRQGRNALCNVKADGDEYCCLGVGCEVYQEMTGKLAGKVAESGNVKVFGDDSHTLPREVAEFLNVTSHGHLPPSDGAFSEGALTDLNDSERKTFGEIADVIESGVLLPFDAAVMGNIHRNRDIPAISHTKPFWESNKANA